MGRNDNTNMILIRTNFRKAKSCYNYRNKNIIKVLVYNPLVYAFQRHWWDGKKPGSDRFLEKSINATEIEIAKFGAIFERKFFGPTEIL